MQPADGRDGQNDLAVVDAGVIEIDDQPIESTTTEARRRPNDDDQEPSAPHVDGRARVAVDIDDSTKTLCRNEKRTLKTAIEDYRADQGTAPTSEGDLIAFAYLRAASALYDVRVDGSVVAQGDDLRSGCADPALLGWRRGLLPSCERLCGNNASIVWLRVSHYDPPS